MLVCSHFGKTVERDPAKPAAARLLFTSSMAPYSFRTEELTESVTELRRPKAPNAEPEPESEPPQHAEEAPNAMQRAMQEALEDFTARFKGWSAMMAHINCTGQYSLAEYETIFGRVEVDHPYGVDFWVGFEKILAEYTRVHLYWYSVHNFAKGYFRKPARFSEKAAQVPFEQKLQEMDREYPCVFVEVQPEWYNMVCISIAIRCSRPWIVHYTWIRRP